MIDIDFTDELGNIRAIIGDPQSEFVTDATIISALAKFGSEEKAALVIMEMMVAAFATYADREREGQVEIYYTQLYDKYKNLLDDYKKTFYGKKCIPIIIGGVSLKQKADNIEDSDFFNSYDMSQWHELMLNRYNKLYEDVFVGIQ